MVVPRSRGVRTGLLAFVALLTITSPALAEGPRLVRVIWDVGQGQVFYRFEDQADTEADGFVVPAGAIDAKDFTLASNRPFLRKGDRVRVYAVNYNPVAHVWHESSTAENVPLAPSIAGPLINAALLAVTGGGQMSAWATVLETKPPDECEGVIGAVTALRGDVVAALKAGGDLVADANAIEDLAKRVDKAPTSPDLWPIFRADQALDKLKVLVGTDADTKFDGFRGKRGDLVKGVEAFNAQLLKTDTEMTTAPACGAKHKSTRDALVEAMKDMLADGSAVRKVLARLESASSAWDAMKARLARPWTDDAIPIVIKEAVPADAVVRIDAVFVSVDKSLNRRIQRTLVLEVEPHMPLLTVSTGVGFNWLRFKTLQITQGTAPNKDGVTVARNRLEIVDDTDWNSMTPVWLQNIRVWGHGDLGVYGTFGTTPDRNIFENAIVGGSLVIRRWRTTVTVAGITARGYREKDLEPVRTRFSDADGFTIPDVKLDAVPLPPASWKWSPMVSVTINVVQF